MIFIYLIFTMEQDLTSILKSRFGLDDFRMWQREIIESVINQNDTLIFMPTWWWKSLIYQLSGMVLEGLVLVISPLISLQKDQVDKLNHLGIRASMINSTISSWEKDIILDEISMNSPDEDGAIKFVYIAPERLGDHRFLEIIKKTKIALVAIDEAHCISQWWHDFRPSYLKIRDFIFDLKKYSKFPTLWLTATATKKVRDDIVDRLGMTEYRVFTRWFDRKNLILIVRQLSKEDEKLEKLLDIITTTPPYGIVYCSSIKNVSKVYQYLQNANIKVGIYTWDMAGNLREREQNMFMNWDYEVMVATNAFGMGIDKRDIRYVVHYNLPGSIENYYQEVWRAGRDGKNSYGVVLASYQDTKIQEFFIENTYPPMWDIRRLYDYFYEWLEIWDWEGREILETYYTIASKSDLWSDMKVWSIIKILEKYGIVKRWYSSESDFRGRWITLVLPRMRFESLPVDWVKQDLLKDETYFKLEQIKKLLFTPSCRKKFILEYFWDSDDLESIWDSCGMCDYCIEKKKFESGDIEYLVSQSIFFNVLDFTDRLSDKFGLNSLIDVLIGSNNQKILNWWLDSDSDYGLLKDYQRNLIVVLFELLIDAWYIEKSTGMYPKLKITKLWKASLYDNSILLDEVDSLQKDLAFRAQSYIKKSKSMTISKPKINTYDETFRLIEDGLDIKQISLNRELSLQTIEWHIVSLYEFDKLTLVWVLKYSTIDHLKEVKKAIKKNKLDPNKLKPIKELVPSDISYFDIKLAIAMINKDDL